MMLKSITSNPSSTPGSRQGLLTHVSGLAIPQDCPLAQSFQWFN